MKGQDLFILFAAAAAGAVGWQMYKDSKKRTNPDGEMEDHLAVTRIQEKLAQLDTPMQQHRPTIDVEAIERRLRRLEHSRKNPRRDEYDDRDDEYDDD